MWELVIFLVLLFIFLRLWCYFRNSLMVQKRLQELNAETKEDYMDVFINSEYVDVYADDRIYVRIYIQERGEENADHT